MMIGIIIIGIFVGGSDTYVSGPWDITGWYADDPDLSSYDFSQMVITPINN